jgi:hypothetical protein
VASAALRGDCRGRDVRHELREFEGGRETAAALPEGEEK